MLTLKNALIILLLILALALSSWSIFISNKKKSTTPTDPSEPDAFMENVVATMINKQGTPALKIESPKMTHFSKNDTTHIETPHITVFRQSPEPWHINSDFAKATKGIEQIFFWSNVIIRHSYDIATPMTTMKTDTLTIFPNKKIAKTDDAITVLQPNTTINAIGMVANLNEGSVKLLSSARGEYVPNR